MITTLDGVYLDHNATTPVDTSLYEFIPNWLSQFGNPSSIHQASRGPRTLIREARHHIAETLGVSPLEIVFNSGASEGNNSIIKSVWDRKGVERNEFICSSVEHPSVMKAMQAIQKKGAVIHWIPVNRDGELDMAFVQRVLSHKTALISVMSANNETGTLFPVAQLVPLARAAGALIHSDCVQVFGKQALNLKELGVDYATFSGHKFYALKGSGFMYLKKTAPFVSLIDGGAQERFRRGGTENTLGVAAMGHIVQKMKSINLTGVWADIQSHRDFFETEVRTHIPGVHVTAQKSPRLGNTSHVMIQGIDAETLLINLDLDGFFVSTGAACSSGNPEPSPVLLSMGFSRQEAQTSLRISLGWNSKRSDMERFVERLKDIVARLRQMKKEWDDVAL
ncbi:MAG: cysteine desulfurase [Bdellovibrionaceae bacterium]|nr:cysteine desulfurase [Pseudobdellovibrionaceae bacterium]